jgi:transposase
VVVAWSAGLVSDRKPYPSDLSDAAWTLIEPIVTAWKARHPSPTGNSGRYEMREILNGIFCQTRTGCRWEYQPNDLPPRSATMYYFRAWRGGSRTRRGTRARFVRRPASTRR